MSSVSPQKLITTWFERAQLDYCDLYMRLFVAYNAWFRHVTAQPNDRASINALKKRFVIWDDYQRGRSMQQLRLKLDPIITMTNRDHSLGVVVRNDEDWQNLIEFWYQVRCHLFHGSSLFSESQQLTWAKLAYESLNIFMAEVVDRMKRSFTNEDYIRLQEVQTLLRSEGSDTERLIKLHESLQSKFVRSPDLWNVDMVHV
jgi:hypothetical protein